MEGDPSQWFYIASQGKIKIIKHTLSGKDIILEVKSPGEIFCCAGILDNRPYPESAKAMNAASVIRMSRQNLLKILEEYPLLNSEIAKYASDMLKDAHEMIKNIATEKVEKRIASMLIKLSEKDGVEDSGYRKIDFLLTRRDLAEMVGTTTETCIRTMSKFQKQGVVKASGSEILVKADSLKNFLYY
jgi:CRP/FNR family transcriptional regulator